VGIEHPFCASFEWDLASCFFIPDVELDTALFELTRALAGHYDLGTEIGGYWQAWRDNRYSY
jgi:hypothetical protein